MTNTLLLDLANRGHLARSSELRALGHNQRAIDRAITDGALLRPIRGWLATPEARRDAIAAVAHRGVLTGASALRTHGVWAGTDMDIHVLVPPNVPSTIARLAHPLSAFSGSRSSGRVTRHWAHPLFESDCAWRASVMDALVAFSKRESAEFAIAAIDSALHTQALPARHLATLVEHLPRSVRHSFALVDGRSEAGTETLARLRLLPLATRVDIQVPFGRFRLDILLDGWLNVEIDSEEWHGKERLANSRRDTWLTARGLVVLRFDYQEVMYEWESCAAAVLASLRDPRRRHVDARTLR